MQAFSSTLPYHRLRKMTGGYFSHRQAMPDRRGKEARESIQNTLGIKVVKTASFTTLLLKQTKTCLSGQRNLCQYIFLPTQGLEDFMLMQPSGRALDSPLSPNAELNSY